MSTLLSNNDYHVNYLTQEQHGHQELEHSHSHRDHDHNHGHNHHHSDNQKLIFIAFLIIATYMVVEVVGGWVTGSLALLSDAGHMFSDALSLAMTLVAFVMGKKTANMQKTFGYRRFEILIAFINGLTLLLISFWIVYEAIMRLQQPPQIATTGMFIISIIGLIVNLVVAKLLHGGDTDNLNMKSAYLHVLSDLLGSVAAIVAAILIMAFGWVWADAVVSVLVAILILRSGFSVVKNASHILMEGSPEEIDQGKIIQTLEQNPQVISVHDLHIWSITSGIHSLSCHVIVSGVMTIQETDHLLHQLQNQLKALEINHSTIQIESEQHEHVQHFDCDIAIANLKNTGHTHSH